MITLRPTPLLAAALGLALVAGPALAEPFTFIFANNTWDILTKVEIAPAGSGAWVTGAEGSQIDTGHATITLAEAAPDCLYDLRATLKKGDGSEHTAERLAVDICAQDKPMDYNVYTFAE